MPRVSVCVGLIVSPTPCDTHAICFCSVASTPTWCALCHLFLLDLCFLSSRATLLCQFRDEQTYYRLRHTNPPESLEVEVDDLESKAGEFGIYDLSGFYKSSLFKEKRYCCTPPSVRLVWSSLKMIRHGKKVHPGVRLVWSYF